jgi:hypothetical protein
MPLTDPDPHDVLINLEALLGSLRALSLAYPAERAYVTAAENVAAAVAALETVPAAKGQGAAR